MTAVELEDAFSCVLNQMTAAVCVLQHNQQSPDQAEVGELIDERPVPARMKRWIVGTEQTGGDNRRCNGYSRIAVSIPWSR